MKKITLFLSIVAVLVSTGCKKGDEEKKADAPIAKKYAKYVCSLREKPDLKKFVARIEKAEEVDLLEELEVKNAKGKVKKIAKIQLSGGTEIGYIDAKFLADKPIVITEEIKGYRRPTTTTSFKMIPKGTLAFIIAEKAEWVQIEGKTMEGKSVYKKWIKEGYTTNPELVIEARTFEAALIKLKNSKTEVEAKEELQKIADDNSYYAEMAKEKLGLQEAVEEKSEEAPAEEKVESPAVEENVEG